MEKLSDSVVSDVLKVYRGWRKIVENKYYFIFDMLEDSTKEQIINAVYDDATKNAVVDNGSSSIDSLNKAMSFEVNKIIDYVIKSVN